MAAGTSAGGSDGADAGWLEKLRQSGIRIDREGRFIHEGAPVTHEGLMRALFRWLDREGDRDQDREKDGRYVFRLDANRFAYVEVDDTPLVARAARLDSDGTIWLALSDGAEEQLDPETLTVDGDGVLRAWVRNGRLEARLAGSAVAALAEQFTDSPDGQPALRVAGGLRSIPRRRAG